MAPRTLTLANNLATTSSCGRYAYASETLPRWFTFELDAAYSIEYLQLTGEAHDNSAVNDETSSWAATYGACTVFSN